MMKLEDKINISRSKKDADLVIKNAKIIDVFGGGIIEGDLAISSGIIMGIGDYKGLSEIDNTKRTFDKKIVGKSKCVRRVLCSRSNLPKAHSK